MNTEPIYRGSKLDRANWLLEGWKRKYENLFLSRDESRTKEGALRKSVALLKYTAAHKRWFESLPEWGPTPCPATEQTKTPSVQDIVSAHPFVDTLRFYGLTAGDLETCEGPTLKSFPYDRNGGLIRKTADRVDVETVELRSKSKEWRWFFRLDNLAVRVFPKRDEI